AALVLAALLLTGCGGGGGSDSPPAPPAASLSYSSPLVFVVGGAITPVKPTMPGTLTNFTISPALPNGLFLDPATGILSGTPAEIRSVETYTVSAFAGGGNAIATVSIAVKDNPPAAVDYRTSALTYTTNIAAVKFTPAVTGGTVS